MRFLPFAVLVLTFSHNAISRTKTANDFSFGGHVRANYDHRDWVDSNDRSRFEFESIKLTVNGRTGPVTVKADYRHYENVEMDVVKYADATYHWTPNSALTLGITKAPFGLLPAASNSFWFSVNYYLGLEDDYDAGAVFSHNSNDWQWHLGYFFNDEYNKADNFDRYSFDVADDGEFRNKENGQFNLRLGKTLRHDFGETHLGISYQYGRILNLDTNREGDHSATAVHLRHQLNNWKLELQYLEYDYSLEAPEGQRRDRVMLSAFTFASPIASEAESFTAGVVYKLPFKTQVIDSIHCYSEYGRVSSGLVTGRASTQWVNGCYYTMGGLVIYTDSIRGQNMWFSGGPGVGLNLPGNADTTHRLNINFGYYF